MMFFPQPDTSDDIPSHRGQVCLPRTYASLPENGLRTSSKFPETPSVETSGFLQGLLGPISGDGFYPEHMGLPTLITDGTRRLLAFASRLTPRAALLAIFTSC